MLSNVIFLGRMIEYLSFKIYKYCEQTVISRQASAKTGVLFKETRVLVDDLLQRKLENPDLNILGE